MKKTKYLSLSLMALCAVAVHAQKIVDDFEYASSEDLAAAWIGSANATVTTTTNVAATSTGKTAMQVQFNFPLTASATETIKGPIYDTPISINSTQYLTFRVKGDPAFKASTFHNLYLYAYDADFQNNGKFGRWGAASPTTDDWYVFNFLASDMQKPWDSPELPDLNQIGQFAFFQYGNGDPASAEYSATIAIDDLMVRDTPLNEPAPNQESVVDNFEYSTAADLTAAWTAVTNAVIEASDSVAPLSTGKTSMKVTFTFPSTAGSAVNVKGPSLTNSIRIGSHQYVTVRVKGDPAFAAADYRNFYIYAYDASGNFGRWGAPVPTNSDWQVFNFSADSMENPSASKAPLDTWHITQFSLMQYGSQAAIPAYSASVSVDDIMIRNTPLTEAAPSAPVERTVENFEYATTEDLIAAWTSDNFTVASISDSVDPHSTGKTSMELQLNFPSSEWATATITGPWLTNNPVVISPTQYVTFRVKGDSAFSASDYSTLFLYAYDTNGNVGRWGAPVPATNVWKVFNFSAGSILKPWDSPALPDLSHIVRFAFYQYGSQAAIDAYTATIDIDDIMIRNSPLNEFPAPSAAREVIDDFESYSSTSALESAYTYNNSPATSTTTAASIVSPAPQGSKALKLDVNFSAGQYPWGAIGSTGLTPFSFPTNAVVTLKFKGDPSLAAVADAGTSFWLTFYDNAGKSMDFISHSNAVISSDWITLQASLKDFGDTSTIDIGNLTSWRILVQGWEGSENSLAQEGVFYVDDIRITIPPAATINVTGTAKGLNGTTITGIVLDEANKTVTADLPKTGQGFLTISPAQKIKSVQAQNGKLVIRW